MVFLKRIESLLMVTLNLFKVDEPLFVCGFGLLPKVFVQRMYGLGLRKGAHIILKHVAPLGCPIAIQVGNTLLSIRRSDFTQLELERA
tara:strand:- start:396 stop:659 length:264 start_codon:yes stop_codon:yes gene_type:complete